MKFSKKKKNPKVQLENLFMTAVSSMAGDTFALRQVRGKLFITDRPVMGRRPTKKQQLMRKRFIEASGYANAALANTALKALYMKANKRQLHSAWMAAVGDYLRQPFVYYVDVSKFNGAMGDPIAIKTEGDHQVARVQVTVISGGSIETGEAVQNSRNELLWRYKVIKASAPGDIKLKISVFDTAGNEKIIEDSFSFKI